MSRVEPINKKLQQKYIKYINSTTKKLKMAEVEFHKKKYESVKYIFNEK